MEERHNHEHTPDPNHGREHGCDHQHTHDPEDHQDHDHAHEHQDPDHPEGSCGIHGIKDHREHESHHAHAHGHHHHDHHWQIVLNERHQRILRWVFLMTLGYLVVEIVGGLMTGSLALLADGAHMFADAAGIGLSLFAAWFAHRPAPVQQTFGYQRIEILAAFFNAVFLLAMGALIIYESFERFQSPGHIHASLMMGIAFGGFIVNLIAAWLLHGDMHTNLNIRGAFLHVLGDLLGSAGAMAAGFFIMMFGWTWMDPLISGFIALLVVGSAIGLLRDAVNVLLEGCPPHLDIGEVRTAILNFEGIEAIHHLHVWSINMQRVVLTAHLEVTPAAFSGETLTRIQHALKEDFDLSHVTIQMELS